MKENNDSNEELKELNEELTDGSVHEGKALKIKKEDRAYLYFRENGLGNLNIKFGPEKFTHNTEKFYEILMYGLFKGVSFLSGLTKKEDSMKRREHYNTISVSLSAVVNEAFPDVFAVMKKESEDEILAIKHVEEGIPVSPEFEAKFQEARELLKERFSDKKFLTVAEDNEKLVADIEGQIKLFQEAQDAMNIGWRINPDEVEDNEYSDDFDPKRIVFNLIESKLFSLREQIKSLYELKEEQN